MGINGAGKSTLLKIIVGEMAADEGEVILARGKTLGYLAQQNMLAGHRSIYEEMLDSKKDIIQMEERLRSMEQDMKGQTGQSWRS